MPCDDCVRGFREFLKNKYTAEKRRERFGFENVDFVNPPQLNAQNPPQKMQIIFDPAIQEWIDFRCQMMADALREMAAYAKSLNPEVVIEINPHGITGGNRAWEAGLDHARLLKHTQVFWTEEGNQPGLRRTAGWSPRSAATSWRGRSQHSVHLHRGDPIAMAECLAFNQTIGYAGNDPLDADMLQVYRFLQEEPRPLQRRGDAGNVAVLRSYASIAYNHARAS